jgi:hypothetical protein
MNNKNLFLKGAILFLIVFNFQTVFAQNDRFENRPQLPDANPIITGNSQPTTLPNAGTNTQNENRRTNTPPTTGQTTPQTPTTQSTTPTTTAGTVTYESYTNFPGVGRISNLCQLMTGLWYLGFAVLLTSVLGMFLWGGYIYVTAGVNAGKVNQAKEIFTNTITGLIIGLSIFIIINVINPGLLQGNCSIPSVGSGSTIGGPAGPSNIVPKPGESVFPVTYLYQGPSGGQTYGAPRRNRDGSYRSHAGIDFTPCWADTTPGGVPYTRAGWEAQPILAFRDGTVDESRTGYLGVTHADGVRTRYVHNSRNLVRVGDSVTAGQEIARVGNIDTKYAHLHFEVYINGAPVNPANILLDSSRNPDPSKVKTTGSPRSGCAGLLQ